METFKNITGYILGGLFFLGVIIIYASFRGQFHWSIFLTGVVLIIIPASTLYIYNWYDSRPKKGEPRPRRLSELKFLGKEIKVDLTKCKIKSISKGLQRVEYTATVDGKRRVFRSNPVSKDRQTLHFLLEVKQDTSIYIDPYEPRYYYFDLEFLES